MAAVSGSGESAALVVRKLCAPELPPGVVPDTLPSDYMALDSASMAQLYAYAGTLCDNGFPGYQYLAQLTQKSEYRAPAETMASEMTRKFIRLVSTGAETDTNDRIAEIDKALADFKVRDLFRQLAEQDDFYGRSQLYVKLKGLGDNKARLPLMVDDKGIAKDSLEGFKVIEPLWTTPYKYNSTDPTRDDFYCPETWFVLGKEIHSTRLLTFVSRPLPDMLKPAYNFSGMSMSQLMEPYVMQWYRTRDSVSNLLHNFSIIVLKTNLQATLSEGGDGGELWKRIQLFINARDNRGLMALDKDSEELEQIAVPLSGLDDLQAQAQEHMAAPSHIPLVKLLGITPAGLNANSDGEIRVFYDFVKARQEAFFRPHLTTVIKMLQLHLFGSIDESITFEFIPLHESTPAENATIRKADADTAAAYITAGVISPDEARERIASDPESGYDGLEGDAPGMPEFDLMDHEHGLNQSAEQAAFQREGKSATVEHQRGERGKDKDAQRTERQARNDHKRELQLTRAKGKP